MSSGEDEQRRGTGARQRRGAAAAERRVALLKRDPDLGEDLREDEFELARRAAVAEVVSYPTGHWRVGPDDFDQAANFGLLIIEGLLARQVTVADYTCAELLGPGDVLQPWLRIGPERSVATEVGWEVVQPLEAAKLEREFSSRVARWPEITAAVSRRLMQRTHWLAVHLAICGLRRVDDRLLLVLWHFADRWGKVGPEGVRLDVRLTHDLLAAVTGARRPSVSAGLQRLVEQGLVERRPRSGWLLRGGPPAQLERLHQWSGSPGQPRQACEGDEDD